MTSSDDDAGRNDRSDSPAGGSEPSSAGYEAPPIEQSATPPDYTPPPAYNALADPGGWGGPDARTPTSTQSMSRRAAGQAERSC